MITNTITEPKIRKRINHDSMWISCQFPSGGYFKLTILRYGKELDIGFSNDDSERNTQMKIFQQWIKENTITYGQLFQRLEQICMTCKSGKELITKMK